MSRDVVSVRSDQGRPGTLFAEDAIAALLFTTAVWRCTLGGERATVGSGDAAAGRGTGGSERTEGPAAPPLLVRLRLLPGDIGDTSGNAG
jgi:hypothetical protein